MFLIPTCGTISLLGKDLFEFYRIIREIFERKNKKQQLKKVSATGCGVAATCLLRCILSDHLAVCYVFPLCLTAPRTGEGAENGVPLSDADRANMHQAELRSLQMQLGKGTLS